MVKGFDSWKTLKLGWVLYRWMNGWKYKTFSVNTNWAKLFWAEAQLSRVTKTWGIHVCVCVCEWQLTLTKLFHHVINVKGQTKAKIHESHLYCVVRNKSGQSLHKKWPFILKRGSRPTYTDSTWTWLRPSGQKVDFCLLWWPDKFWLFDFFVLPSHSNQRARPKNRFLGVDCVFM